MHTADKDTWSRVTLSRVHRLAVLMLASFVGISASVAQTPWSQQYVNLNYFDAVSNPLPSGDGGVWMAYARFDGGFTLEKRDAAGALVLRTSRGALPLDAGQLQIATGAGGFIYVAFNGAGTCSVVMRFDGQGNLDWERSLTNRCNGRTILTLTGTADGGVVVGTGALGGYRLNRPIFSRSTTSISLAKLNQQGNAVWTRNVDPPAGGEMFQLNQLIEDSSGALFFVGESGRVIGPTTYVSQAVVGSLSATGNLQWIQSLGSSAQTAFGLCEWDATALAVVGGSNGGPLGSFRGYLALVSKTGVPGTGFLYEGGFSAAFNQVFRSISTLPNGARWIVGYEYPNFAVSPANGDVIVGQIDSTGVFTSLAKFSEPGDEIPNQQIAAWSNGFALSGISTSFTPGGRAAAFLQTYTDAGTNCLAPTAIFPGYSPLTISSIPNGTTFTAVTASTGPSNSGIVSSLDPGEEVLCGARCVEDAAEPDDACDALQPALPGQAPARHQFCAAPDDWVTVNACAGEVLDIVSTDLGPTADTLLEVYGPGCTASPLISNDNNGTDLAAAIRNWTVPQSGAYHVRLHSNTGAGSGRGASLIVSGNTASCNAYATTFAGSAGRLDEAYAVDNDGRGGLWVAGRTDSGAGNSDLGVLRLDAGGQLVESFSLSASGSGLEEARTVKRTPDGGVIVAGNSPGSGFDQDALVWKRDAGGVVSWQNRLHRSARGIALAGLAVASDGTGYALLRVSNPGSVVADVVEFSPTGVFLRSVGIASVGSVDPRAITATADGGVVAVLDVADTGSIVIMKFDRLLNWQWQADYDDGIFGSVSLSARGVSEASSGELWVAGKSTSGSGPSDGFLLRLESDGSEISQSSYSGGNSLDISAIAATANGGATLVGTLAGDIVAFRVDGNSEIVWNYEYGSPSENEKGLGVVRTFDGSPGIVGAGGPGPSAKQIIWVLHPDNDGNIGGVCTQQYGPDVSSGGASFTREPATDTRPQDPVLTGWVASNLINGALSVTQTISCSGPARGLPDEVSGSGTGFAPSTPLRILADRQTLTWESAGPNNSDRFTLARGDVAQLSSGNYGDCLADAIASSTYIDAASPEAGQAWFYLVRGENNAGNGVLGKDSAGRTRVYWGRCAH